MRTKARKVRPLYAPSHKQRQKRAFDKIDQFIHARLLVDGLSNEAAEFAAKHGVRIQRPQRRTPMTRFARRSVRAARRHAGSTTRRTTRTSGGGSSGDDGPASPPACERRTVTPSVRRAR